MRRTSRFLRALPGRGTLRVPDVGRESSRPSNRAHRFGDSLRSHQKRGNKGKKEKDKEGMENSFPHSLFVVSSIFYWSFFSASSNRFIPVSMFFIEVA